MPRVEATSLAKAVALASVKTATEPTLPINNIEPAFDDNTVKVDPQIIGSQQTIAANEKSVQTENTPTLMEQKSGTTYLEVNFPQTGSSNTTTTGTTSNLTEDQKKQRAIIVGSVVLVLLVVIIVLFTRKTK